MRTWMTPSFDTLPRSSDQRFRFAGSRLVDEEQYRVEGWQRSEDGYWRISVEGCLAYSRLRGGRRADRKAAWQEREEHEQAYTDYVNTLVDGGVAW